MNELRPENQEALIVDTRQGIPPTDAVENRRKKAEEMVELGIHFYETGELPDNLSEIFGDVPQAKEIVTFTLNAFRGKFRKDGKTPLAVHSLMLGVSAKQHGITDPEVFPTTLLHDVAEDTELGVEDVQKQFGDQMAKRAMTMTEERLDDRFESIARFVDKLKSGGPTIAKVELLDRRDDLLDLGYLTDKLQKADLSTVDAEKIRVKLGEKFAKCRWTIDAVTRDCADEPEVARLKKDFDAIYEMQKEQWQVPNQIIQTDIKEYEAR